MKPAPFVFTGTGIDSQPASWLKLTGHAYGAHNMKLRFRTTLLLVLLTIVVATVAAIGLSGYHTARFTTEELSRQVLNERSARIQQRIISMLQGAAAQSELVRLLILNKDIPGGEEPRAENFTMITAYFYEAMKVHLPLTFLSLGIESTGEYCHVERKADGSLVIQECIRNAAGKIERQDYRVVNGERVQIRHDIDWHYDPRTRPYYKAAREAREQTWTETYVFTNDPSPDSPGVTCATPILGTDGRLLGVVSADFNLESLCGFLRETPAGRGGFALVVEILRNGHLQLIGHPDLNVLIKQQGHEHQLMPMEELTDRNARALLRHLDSLRATTSLPDSNQFQFSKGDIAYFGYYRRLPSPGFPRWLICTVVPEEEILQRVWRANQITLIIGAASLVLAAIASFVIARQVARPLEKLTRETEAIGRLRLDDQPRVMSSVREIDRLSTATETMKFSLRSFQKYVPADLVRSLVSSGKEAKLGGERRVVTICFADIVDFTGLSEKLEPEMLVSLLGENMSLLTKEILAAGGTVDKFMGDSIMAFWGAPVANAHHALDACRAAIRCRDQLSNLHQRWREEGKPPFLCRFGINTGEVLVGNVGSEARLNYTVIGNGVNLASRLEGLNKVYGTQIILSEATYHESRHGIVARPLNWVAVKGKSEAVLVYELLGMKGETSHTNEEFAELCATALASYSKQEWTRSIELFERALAIKPQDLPVTMLMSRCNLYQSRPPGDDWDRVHRIDNK